MSNQPLTLTDDDFAEDAPPGYLSHRSKQTYVPQMATLLGVTFVLQLVLPMALTMIVMPQVMFPGAMNSLPQYSKLTAWQDALWYPTIDQMGGGPRADCQLSAIDYAGEPVEQPAIHVDLQPEWLVADKEKLWAVSRNEIAEVFPDGTRPVVMHPTRFLHQASKPFIEAGRLLIVDRDDNGPFTLFAFENGEWVSQQVWHVPHVDLPEAPQETLPAEDAPADALQPAGTGSAVQPPKLPQPVAPTFPPVMTGPRDELQVVIVDSVPHVVFAQHNKLFHHQGHPTGQGGAASDKTNWQELPVSAAHWTLTAVKGAPAIAVQTSDGTGSLQLWRWTDDRWQPVATGDVVGLGTRQELTSCTTADGLRTFVVVESLSGLSQELLELTPDSIQSVSQLQSFMMFANPFSADYFYNQLLIQSPSQMLMVILILGSTWLMKRYRDPFFYKGRTAVEYASLLRRCLAVMIDMMIVMGPVYVAVYLAFTRSDMTMAKLFRMIESDTQALWQYFLSLMPLLTSIIGWFFLCEFIEWLMISFWGCTVGKFFCGVRVARTNLEQPGLLRGLVRNLLSWIELPMFNGIIGFSLVAFLQNRQRLADLVAGTVVLKAKSLRAAQMAMAADPGSNSV